MTRRITSGLVLAVAALATLAGAAGSAAARAPRRPVKPSIRIAGIAVDTYNFLPGTKVTYEPNNPVNACYDIGGPDQDPPQVDVVFFIHETGIPASAPVTVSIATPWDTQTLPEPEDLHPTFGNTWFRNTSHNLAEIYGGSDAPGNYYHFDDEGTRGEVFNGFYSVYTTVKVHGTILHARGRLTIDCDD